jgi:hypothetical protein
LRFLYVYKNAIPLGWTKSKCEQVSDTSEREEVADTCNGEADCHHNGGEWASAPVSCGTCGQVNFGAFGTQGWSNENSRDSYVAIDRILDDSSSKDSEANQGFSRDYLLKLFQLLKANPQLAGWTFAP